jgi:hypothetical protein
MFGFSIRFIRCAVTVYEFCGDHNEAMEQLSFSIPQQGD